MIREIRMIAFLMAIIIICLALGALSAPQRDLSAKQEEHQKRFGAVYMTLNNPFYEIIDEEIRTEVEKHGDVLLSRDPALSVEKQTEEIEDLIREGVSVIFLNPVDFERMGPALEAARAAHIPVVTIDTNVQDSDFVASTIETDNYAAGRACAEHLLQHADHANILLLKHSSAHSAVDRITGFRQTIAGHPGSPSSTRRSATGSSSAPCRPCRRCSAAIPRPTLSWRSTIHLHSALWLRSSPAAGCSRSASTASTASPRRRS